MPIYIPTLTDQIKLEILDTNSLLGVVTAGITGGGEHVICTCILSLKDIMRDMVREARAARAAHVARATTRLLTLPLLTHHCHHSPCWGSAREKPRPGPRRVHGASPLAYMPSRALH